jgi:hypothetical protein
MVKNEPDIASQPNSDPAEYEECESDARNLSTSFFQHLRRYLGIAGVVRNRRLWQRGPNAQSQGVEQRISFALKYQVEEAHTGIEVLRMATSMTFC